MNFLVLLVLLLLNLTAAVAEEDTAKTLEEMRKLPIKSLKQFLSERGLSCKGCSEKDEFAQLAFNNQNTPKKIQRMEEPKNADNDQEIQDLMNKLKASGMGGAKLFSAKDLEGLSAEDMAEKFSTGSHGKKGRKGKGQSKKGNGDKKPRGFTIKQDGVEDIDL